MLIEIKSGRWINPDRIIEMRDLGPGFPTQITYDYGEGKIDRVECMLSAELIARNLAPIATASPGFVFLECHFPDLEELESDGIDPKEHKPAIWRTPIPAWRMFRNCVEPALLNRYVTYGDAGQGVLCPNGTVLTPDGAKCESEDVWLQVVRHRWLRSIEDEKAAGE